MEMPLDQLCCYQIFLFIYSITHFTNIFGVYFFMKPRKMETMTDGYNVCKAVKAYWLSSWEKTSLKIYKGGCKQISLQIGISILSFTSLFQIICNRFHKVAHSHSDLILLHKEINLESCPKKRCVTKRTLENSFCEIV